VFGSHDKHGESRRERNGSRRPSLGARVAASSELYLEDELAHAKVYLPAPFYCREYHLFCSEYNAGALALAEELRASDVFVMKRKKVSAELTFIENIDKLAECDHSSAAVQPNLSAPLQPLTRRLSGARLSGVASARAARRAHMDERH
jgi:hypothetical protein